MNGEIKPGFQGSEGKSFVTITTALAGLITMIANNYGVDINIDELLKIAKSSDDVAAVLQSQVQVELFSSGISAAFILGVIYFITRLFSSYNKGRITVKAKAIGGQ